MTTTTLPVATLFVFAVTSVIPNISSRNAHYFSQFQFALEEVMYVAGGSVPFSF